MKGSLSGGLPLGSKQKEDPDTQDKKDDKKDNAPAPSWHKNNSDKELGWCLPSGKAYNDFFKFRSPNLKKFPKLPHHAWFKDCNMCIKYQTNGKCTRGSRCLLLHQPKFKMSTAEVTAIDAAFREIYGS